MVTQSEKPLNAIPNVLVRASAGTGKTFRLTNRFLELLNHDVAVDEILATTFTRKAAREILDRIMFRLAEAAQSKSACQELGHFIQAPSLDQPRVLQLLRNLLEQLHRLQICTLDSYFSRLATGCSLEMGLPLGWMIADDLINERIRSEAVGAVLKETEREEVLTLLRMLSKQDAARGIHGPCKMLLGNLYTLYKETPRLTQSLDNGVPPAWRQITYLPPLDPDVYLGHLKALRDLEIPDGTSHIKAKDEDYERIESKQWEAFLKTGIATKVLKGETKFSRKEIDPAVIATYQPLVEHAKSMTLAAIDQHTQAAYRFLHQFHVHYEELKKRHRVLRFEDITFLLAHPTKSGEGESLNDLDDTQVESYARLHDFRLDAPVSNLLLDEFQDTSRDQWLVLSPMAEKLTDPLAKDQTFFCVGDTKQAIYSWRGGDANIFDALETQLHDLKEESLNVSFRSSPVIIKTVNQIFQTLDQNAGIEKYKNVACAFTQQFPEHAAHHKNLPGYALLEVAPEPDEGEKPRDAALKHAALRIQQITNKAPCCSIGVLMRNNQSIGALVENLKKLGIQASEEGGNSIAAEPAVAAVLSLFTLADHPGDSVSWYHVMQSPLGNALGLNDSDGTSNMRSLSKRIRQRLVSEGYGPVTSAWVEKLMPHTKPNECKRLQQLVELAYQFEPDATTRPKDFVHYVGHQKVEDPSASRVRVMTIHKSKGLEFDAVVLPDLDRAFRPVTPDVVVGRKSPLHPVEAVCRYASKEIQELFPEKLKAVFQKTEEREIHEALCVLYVAVTRPAQGLYIIIQWEKENKRVSSTPTFSKVIRSALEEENPDLDPEILFETGEPDWFAQAPRFIESQKQIATPELQEHVAKTQGLLFDEMEVEEKSPKAKARSAKVRQEETRKAESVRGITLASSKRQKKRRLQSQSPSKLKDHEALPLSRMLNLAPNTGRIRGTLWHAWLEKIEWLEGNKPSKESLQTALLSVRLPQPEKETMVDEFLTALDEDLLQSVLLEKRYAGLSDTVRKAINKRSGVWKIFRERPFAIQQDEHLLSGIIDRLAVYYENEMPVAAEILDFKTDQLARSADSEQGIKDLVEHYGSQMRAYRQATAQFLKLPEEKVGTVLIVLSAGVWREV